MNGRLRLQMERYNMYNRISGKIANYLILHFSSSLDKRYKDEQVVRYGIEIILSSMLNLVLIILFGTIFWGLLEIVVFVLFFCPIRQYAGGYHAKTHLRCTLGFLLFYVMFKNSLYSVRGYCITYGNCTASIRKIGK